MTASTRKKHKTVRIIVAAAALVFVLMTIWFFVPVTEEIDVGSEYPEDQRIRCVLITDLHSCRYGKGQSKLISMIDEADPDIVFLGGDIFDDRIGDDNALALLTAIAGKYECFYVTGNHEYWSGRVDQIRNLVRASGIEVLQGDTVTLSINGREVDISGVDDPTYMTDDAWLAQLESAYEGTDPDHTRILLSHRPERVSYYERYDYDLILSGHAHAGQILLPFLDVGTYAPDQGFFAQYVNGTYTLSNGSILVVSRGLARESTPLPRFFNHPEIVVFEI